MNNSTALVTGANKGIGQHIARQLAEQGLTVYLGSRDAERGKQAAAEIGGDTRLLLLDVTDAGSIAAAAAQVGELDILVNNAGIMPGDETPPAADVEGFRRTFETNLFGVLAVTNAFLPALRRSSRPRIVNISSGTGSLAVSAAASLAVNAAASLAVNAVAEPAAGSGAAYRVSKTALNALTLFYAQALGDPFKVNALAPGLRQTDLHPRATASSGDPGEAAAGAVRLALLPDEGPSGQFLSWDGTPMPW